MLENTLNYGNTTAQMYRDQTTQAIETLTTQDADMIVEQEETVEV